MKIVRLSKNSNLTRIEKTFNWFRFSGRGPEGTIGKLTTLTNKPIVVPADLALTGDSEAAFANKYSTWQQVINSVIRTALDAIYQAIFNTQNLGTISGAKTINATSFSTITGDFTASFTATFEGFTASRKSVLLHLVVSGGGAPTITIAGYTFTFMTTANLTAMADGTYQVVVNNPKTDTTAFVYVKLAP